MARVTYQTKEDNMTYRIPVPFAAVLTVAALLMPGATPRAQAADKLTISYSQKVADYLPLWIAVDGGYFKKRDLDVSARYLPAQQGIPALLSEQIQMAGIGGTDAASAIAQGTKLKLVFTFSPVNTFQFWARPEYASADKLKGQRVGITSTTGSLYAGTLLALKQLGLTTADVKITPLGASTNVNSSLLAGSIAAGASHPPATYKFKQAGLVELVDLPKQKIPSVSDGVWVSDSYIQAHRDIVQKLVDALVEGYEREKSDRDYAESVLTKELGIKDKPQLDFTYDFYVNNVLAPGIMPQADQVQANIDSLVGSNPKVKTVDAAAVVDQSFVKNAQQPAKQSGTGGALH
jgi:NitT/TauT family transport system substrate-binding protein